MVSEWVACLDKRWVAEYTQIFADVWKHVRICAFTSVVGSLSNQFISPVGVYAMCFRRTSTQKVTSCFGAEIQTKMHK